MDSGIGGIPYCKSFHLRNPEEYLVYFADHKHFPYGTRDKNELITILSNLIEKLIARVNPKIIVIACNTASIASLSILRELFPDLTIIGTVPAIKPAAFASKTGKIGVLGTDFTIKEPLIRELAEKYGMKIIGYAAPELVEFVENRIINSTPEERKKIVSVYLNHFRAKGADTLVLGCTHFLFLQKDFQNEALPDIAVFDSIDGINRRIESELQNESELHSEAVLHSEALLQEANACHADNCILLNAMGGPEPVWTEWAAYLGFRLSLFQNGT